MPSGTNPSEDIMLHALTATIGTLAIIASINIKLACFMRARRSAGAARPPAQAASPGGR